jgi:hypothetical protein
VQTKNGRSITTFFKKNLEQLQWSSVCKPPHQHARVQITIGGRKVKTCGSDWLTKKWFWLSMFAQFAEADKEKTQQSTNTCC